MKSISAMRPISVAHRGSAQHAIENTLPAFAQAIEDGAEALELDIHLTLDKDLAVIHDDTLERTHGYPGEVSKMTSAELRALGVPMLRDVLQLAELPLFVEIKHPKGGHHQGIEQVLVDQLETAKAQDRTTVISFDESSLKKVHQLEPGLATGYLYSGRPIDIEKTRDELGITYLAPHFALVNQDYVTRAHAAGLKVDAWVVNRVSDMKRLAEIPCDALTTDRIPELNSVLAGQPVEIPEQQEEPDAHGFLQHS